MKWVYILSLPFLLLGAGCVSSQTNQIDQNNMSQRIVLKTTDGLEIVGTYRKTGQSKIAILLHMMPATKESWDLFAQKLAEAGYASVAIDERGHGESTIGGKLNYKQFSDEEQQAKRLDVEAAIAFAQEQGFVEEEMVVIGASIGANLAIGALIEHPGISTAIALSPGLDYHGVLTASFINQLSPSQRVILVASDDDAYSFQSVRALHQANSQQTVLIERSGIGHGTTMLKKDGALVSQLLMQLPKL